MNKKEIKIANRVLKELGVYSNYYRELNGAGKKDAIVFLSKRSFKTFISYSFPWLHTKKGHFFWEMISIFFNAAPLERMEKYKLFEEVSILKKHLKLTKKHDFK